MTKTDNRITRLNFNSYYFNRKQFDLLIKNFFNNPKTCPFREFVYQYEKNYDAIQEHDCHIQAFFILVSQTRLPSIYEKLQTNNALQKWHYDPVRSVKDSREYSEKNYNKCKKHYRKPVD